MTDTDKVFMSIALNALLVFSIGRSIYYKKYSHLKETKIPGGSNSRVAIVEIAINCLWYALMNMSTLLLCMYILLYL